MDLRGVMFSSSASPSGQPVAWQVGTGDKAGDLHVVMMLFRPTEATHFSPPRILSDLRSLDGAIPPSPYAEAWWLFSWVDGDPCGPHMAPNLRVLC